jgi:DNA-binding protein HU-beta
VPENKQLRRSWGFFSQTNERNKKMNKTEFIDAVAKLAGLPKTAAADAVNAALEVIAKALKKGDAVQLTGFGTFAVTKRAARKGRNPATGKEIKIAASKAPKFKAGALLKKAVK